MMTSHGGALAPDVYERDLLQEVPVLERVADIDTEILFSLDSSDMRPHHWVELAGRVHRALAERADPGDPRGPARYDGVVVVHGTDTMAYTASALAFLLGGLDRPVVLTGAQTPLESPRSDARSNLVDACYLATQPIPEVGIAFHGKLFRGCCTTKMDAWGLGAFDSPSCAPLAELGVGADLGSHVLAPRLAHAFDPRLEPSVLAVRTFPGLDPRLLLGALDVGVRGLVLEAFGAGNIPRLEGSLVPVLEEARERDVPTVIVSQCPRGRVELGRYEGGAAAQVAGAIGAGTLTPEAAVTKLMIALGRAGGRPIEAARAAFERSWAGEGLHRRGPRTLVPPRA
jgi:L-asparaginase